MKDYFFWTASENGHADVVKVLLENGAKVEAGASDFTAPLWVASQNGHADVVKLLLENGTAYPVEGALQFRDVTVDPTTGSVILRMVFPNPKSVLLPGMFVRVVVQEGIAEQAILVPQQGVSRDPKGNPVALIVDDSGKVQQRMLTLDRTIGDQWLVSSGLAPGDRLIVEGVQRVRPGDAVKVVPFGSPKAAGSTNQPSPASK